MTQHKSEQPHWLAQPQIEKLVMDQGIEVNVSASSVLFKITDDHIKDKVMIGALGAQDNVLEEASKRIIHSLTQELMQYIKHNKSLPQSMRLTLPVNLGNHWIMVATTVEINKECKLSELSNIMDEYTYDDSNPKNLILRFKPGKNKDGFIRTLLSKSCKQFTVQVANSLSSDSTPSAETVAGHLLKKLGDVKVKSKSVTCKQQPDANTCGIFAALNCISFLNDGTFRTKVDNQELIDAYKKVDKPVPPSLGVDKKKDEPKIIKSDNKELPKEIQKTETIQPLETPKAPLKEVQKTETIQLLEKPNEQPKTPQDTAIEKQKGELKQLIQLKEQEEKGKLSQEDQFKFHKLMVKYIDYVRLSSAEMKEKLNTDTKIILTFEDNVVMQEAVKTYLVFGKDDFYKAKNTKPEPIGKNGVTLNFKNKEDQFTYLSQLATNKTSVTVTDPKTNEVIAKITKEGKLVGPDDKEIKSKEEYASYRQLAADKKEPPSDDQPHFIQPM